MAQAVIRIGPPAGASRYRWLVIWLIFIGLSINYLDRASLSVALPFMGGKVEPLKVRDEDQKSRANAASV